MDQRLLFSALALESVVAFWIFPLTLIDAIVGDPSGQLSLYLAEASFVLTAVSLTVAVLGLWRNGTTTPNKSQRMMVLSAGAVTGTAFSAWWLTLWGSVGAMDCSPITLWKCNIAQVGTYASYYSIPAIAVPIVTLVFAYHNLEMTKRLHSEAGLAESRIH